MQQDTKCIIFGTGNSAMNAYYKMKEAYIIVAFADNNEKKQGGSFHGLPIISAGQIKDYVTDRIVIASVFYHEIGRQLAEMGYENVYYIDIENGLLQKFDGTETTQYIRSAENRSLKKVLFVQHSPCVRTYKISCVLRDAGIQADLAYLGKSPTVLFPNSELPWDRLIPIFDFNEFMDFVDASDYDLVHHSNAPDALGDLLLHSNKKVVQDVHDLQSITNPIDIAHATQEYIVNRYSNGIIYCSDETRAIAGDLFRNTHKKTLILENQMYLRDKSLIRLDKLSATDHCLHCVYEGGISPNPNSHRYYEGIFLRMAEQGIHVHFYTHMKLIEYYKKLDDMHPNIHYEGTREYNELLCEMSRYDVGLVILNINNANRQAAYNSSPNKLNDYLAAGLPVALPDGGRFFSYLERHPVGGTFNWDGDLRGQLEAIARVKIPEDFLEDNGLTMESHTAELIQFYESVAFDD